MEDTMPNEFDRYDHGRPPSARSDWYFREMPQDDDEIDADFDFGFIARAAEAQDEWAAFGAMTAYGCAALAIGLLCWLLH
jgi:hypothetical protein